MVDEARQEPAAMQVRSRGGLWRSTVRSFSSPPHESVQVVYGRRERRLRQMPATFPRPSRPGELHPESLTEPDMTLSRHPARATQ
jgi:hypothetical protein